jgi:DNA primase
MVRRTVGRHDLSTIEGQSAAVAAAVPLLEQLGDPVRQSEYAHLLAELAGVSEGSVVLALERQLSGRHVEVQQAIKRASAQERVEREMLRILARDDVAYRSIGPRLSDEHFRSSRNRQLMALLRDADGRVSGASSEGGDDEVVQALTALALEPLDGDQLSGYPEEVWARLQEFLLRRRSVALRQELQKMNPVTDPRYDELFQRLIAADGELRRLREHGHVPA